MQTQFMSAAESTSIQGWRHYAGPPGFWDEMIDNRGEPRDASAAVLRNLTGMGANLLERQKAADLAIRSMGVTFTLYADAGNIDRAWPFDVIPRVISANEWSVISRGLVQRLTAINLFIADLYGKQQIVRDGVFPAELLANSANFRPQCVGIRPVGDVWAHICGSDLVRDEDGTMYVLEDNMRVPSGVSYMLANRSVTKRVFPDMFRDLDIHPVDGYPQQLFELLASLSSRTGEPPTIVVLTPGIYNSAYFEHCFLAEEMGVHLVEGQDLLVADDDCVYMRTIGGLVRVDVIYRRVDDVFLDP
ncbi:MAG TPA: circularly permuted type 2 ATP-grasp protein, partial [Acidimicrobiales bacterium]